LELSRQCEGFAYCYFVEGFTVSVVDRCPDFPVADFPPALAPDFVPALGTGTVVRELALVAELADARLLAAESVATGVDITSPDRVTTTTWRSSVPDPLAGTDKLLASSGVTDLSNWPSL
jgi:hypothetical protein